MGELFGRDAECEIVRAFIAAAHSGFASLTIEGAPGIGKSALWRWGVAQAGIAATVLQCRPSAAEADFAFAALTDLLRALPAEVLAGLPEPQRHALSVAMLDAPTADRPLEPRVLATAVASALRSLSVSRAVIVAIDDSPWLDQSTADVLRFALRRLADTPFGLLQSRREGTRPRLDVQGGDAAWNRTIRLSGLGTGALFHVIRQELHTSLARPRMVALAEASRGNPFFAVELARSDDDSLPLSLRALTTDRIATLSPDARQAVACVAVTKHPTWEMLERLGMAGAVREAEATDIVRASSGRVTFTHPLLAAAAQEVMTAPELRDIHSRLATVVADPETRSRHLAIAQPGADAGVAAALDVAAENALQRGAPLAAVELVRLALARTPAEDALGIERRITLARVLHIVGSSEEARAELSAVLDGAATGPAVAEGALLLTEIARQVGAESEAIAAAERALQASGEDVVLRARALLILAEVGQTAESRRAHARAAQAELAGIVDPPAELLAWALIEEAGTRFNLGEGLDRELVERAQRLERTGRKPRSSDQVAAVRPVLLKWADAHEDAIAALLELRSLAEAEGNEGLLPYVAGHLVSPYLRLGRVADAAREADHQYELAEISGQDGQRIQARYNQALVALVRGDLDRAAVLGREIDEWAVRNDDEWMEMSAASALGHLALLQGDHESGVAQLDRWHALLDTMGVIDPGISRFYGDHVETVLLAGDAERARQLTNDLEAVAMRARRTSALAVAARSRALLAAHAGEIDAALAQANRALELDDACPVPLERGRTLLVRGTIQRRAKAKKAARDSLSMALRLFEGLGAASWVARSRVELDRVGRRAASPFALTATEARVAELSASGLTNRQVAERAFMSPKTVEANLARVYRKLEISSRAELGAAIRDRSRTD